MLSTTLEIDSPVKTESRKKQDLRTKLSVPTNPKLSTNEGISGNNYDVVLACQPDEKESYTFYDDILKLIKEKKDLKAYSPHNDFRQKKSLEEVIDTTTSDAIPRTRGVLFHLKIITPEIQRMFDATYLNHCNFLLIYPLNVVPFDKYTGTLVRNDPKYKGEIIYENKENALIDLFSQIDNLLKGK